MSNYLCRNGHLVKDSTLAGLECAKCRANERRREKRQQEREIFKRIAAKANETAA